MGKPVIGTSSERYLRSRGITAALDGPALRHHPRCYVRLADEPHAYTRPALLAAVTDLDGRITGVQRTWLDPTRPEKARLPKPRRAMGHLLGNGVRFGVAHEVLAAGEGLETMLSLRSVLPLLHVIAALSANHLGALIPPPGCRRLYIVRDDDSAGWSAAERLSDRAAADGIEVRLMTPKLADLNEDLRKLGAAVLLAHVAAQLVPEDRERFAGRIAASTQSG